MGCVVIAAVCPEARELNSSGIDQEYMALICASNPSLLGPYITTLHIYSEIEY